MEVLNCLQKIAEGDATAVAEVLDRYSGLVWTLALRLSANRADAEDAVQEVFIDVWRHAARFDAAIASEATFITMLARRRLVDRHRRASRRLTATSFEDQSSLPEQASSAASSEVQTELAEEAEIAKRQLAQLRPEERQVIELAVLEGLSQSIIAERLRLPLGTVKTHARRGLQRLRSLVEGNTSSRADTAMAGEVGPSAAQRVALKAGGA